MVVVQVFGFVVVWLLLRRVFERAIQGGVPLKTQRSFWPLVAFMFLLGGGLLVRLLSWLWISGHFLFLAGVVGLLAVVFARFCQDLADVTDR